MAANARTSRSTFASFDKKCCARGEGRPRDEAGFLVLGHASARRARERLFSAQHLGGQVPEVIAVIANAVRAGMRGSGVPKSGTSTFRASRFLKLARLHKALSSRRRGSAWSYPPFVAAL